MWKAEDPGAAPVHHPVTVVVHYIFTLLPWAVKTLHVAKVGISSFMQVPYPLHCRNFHPLKPSVKYLLHFRGSSYWCHSPFFLTTEKVDGDVTHDSSHDFCVEHLTTTKERMPLFNLVQIPGKTSSD